jgi:hypothetical protein
MKRIIIVLAGFLGIFIASGIILPALAKTRDFGSMPSDVVGFYTLGIILAVFGAGAAVFGLVRGKSA